MLATPEVTTEEVTYDGFEHTSTFEDTEFYTVQNVTETDAGTYDVILTLIDPDNYKWAGEEESSELKLEFTIKAASELPNLDIDLDDLDGKEFTGAGAEESCRHYEAICNEKECKRLFELLDFKRFELPFLGWACDHDAYFVRLTCDRDYNIMENYFESRMGNYATLDLERPEAYPCTLFVIEDDGYIGTYQSINEAKKLIEQFIENYEKFYGESFY